MKENKEVEVNMDKLMSRFFKSSIISSIALVALGILLIVQSEATIITISYIVGGFLIALGVIAILKYLRSMSIESSKLDIIYGVVCVVLGVLIITNPEAIASIIPFIIGFIIIINSATKLQYSLELKKEKNELWISTLIVSIIMTLCGVVLIFNPFQGAVFITRMVGIFILIYAILDITSTIIINRNLNIIKEAIEETITEAEVIEEKKEIRKIEKKSKKQKEDEDKNV